MCRLSRPILFRVTATMSSLMSFNRMKHGLGLFARAQSATGGYDERVNIIKWPIRLPSSLIKHDWDRFDEENSLRVVTIMGAKYNRLAYSSSDLTRWTANLWASFLFSRCDLELMIFKRNEAKMLLRTDGGRRRVEEPCALIPDVGIEAVSAET